MKKVIIFLLSLAVIFSCVAPIGASAVYNSSVKTETVTLYMGNPAKITTQPKSVVAEEGKTAKTTVKATGDGLSYQ